MKKVMFLFMVLLIGNVIKAQQNISRDVVEQEKTIYSCGINVPSNFVEDLLGDETVGLVENLKKYLGYLLLFLVVVVVVLLKSNKNLKNKYNRLKDNKKKDDKLLTKKTAEVRDLLNMTNRLKQKNTELEERNRVLQEDIENLEEVYKEQIRQSSATTVGSTVSEEKIEQNNLHEYYLGVPQDGMFSEGSDVYCPGKVLYKVLSTDGIYGEFEYINRPETIGYAKQSRTSFLESACNVIGEDKMNFVQIETKRKGKVERVSDGWKIIKKADVCLV